MGAIQIKKIILTIVFKLVKDKTWNIESQWTMPGNIVLTTTGDSLVF